MTITEAKNLTGAQFSTYRIGGPLQEAYQPETQDEAIEILKKAKAENKPITILGWGGNSLIASAGISGVTLITRKLDKVEQLGEHTFSFGAGVHMAKVASIAHKNASSGGEYMIGIPGTVGGAVRMNAGALGQETSDVTRSVTLFNLETGEVETWGPERLNFSYRWSDIDPQKHVVLSAVMEFAPGNADEIGEMMRQSVGFRKSHHPTEPNGGSVFKNPAKDKPVGRLLEELGARKPNGDTWSEGGVRISPKHCNFIINFNGTSTDVLKLMTRMKDSIKEHYGLDVYPENLFLGDATDEEKALWAHLTGGMSPLSSCRIRMPKMRTKELQNQLNDLNNR